MLSRPEKPEEARGNHKSRDQERRRQGGGQVAERGRTGERQGAPLAHEQSQVRKQGQNRNEDAGSGENRFTETAATCFEQEKHEVEGMYAQNDGEEVMEVDDQNRRHR